MYWCAKWGLIARVWRRTNVTIVDMSSQDACFVSSSDVDDIDEADAFVFFAGIVTAFEDAEIDQ
jgi:hypothetical protein